VQRCKKYSSKQPAQTKKNLENECRVYAYLRNTSPEFLENCTCFVNCFTDGILLKNGGNSLEQMLKENTFTFSIVYFQQFFNKLHELHKLLVTHNDLHVGNVVGVFDVRFIDFGLANIHPQQVFDEEFLEMIRLAFSGIFFALCSKYGIME
jgi:tRNA A-37 threonylcarbamoyl transferase component Bud32